MEKKMFFKLGWVEGKKRQKTQARSQDCTQFCRVAACLSKSSVCVWLLRHGPQMWVGSQSILRPEHGGRSDQMGHVPALGLWRMVEKPF